MVGNKEKIEELFATWLAQNAPSAHLSELYFCYSEIEAYCLKIKVLRKPLFETIDLDIIKRVQKTVTESRIFQLSHKKTDEEDCYCSTVLQSFCEIAGRPRNKYD